MFFVKTEKNSEFIVVKILFFSFTLYLNCDIGFARQVFNKIVKTIKRFLGFKYKTYGNKNLNYYVLGPSPDEISYRYGAYFKNNDISKVYLNLIKNLDEKSIETVRRVIERVGICLGNPHSYCRFEPYDDENILISDIDKNLTSQIKKSATPPSNFIYKNYILPINAFEQNAFYFNYGIDEFLQSDKCRGKNIIDGGAFIGDSALFFARHTDKKVYAFEPDPVNYSLMLKTIELNGMDNKIIPIDKGLGDKESEMFVCSAPSGSAASFLSDKSEQNNDALIKTTSIDNFVKQNSLDIGLIKSDVEGFEPNLLLGAIETIKNQKPVLLISIYHNGKDFFEIKPLIESWNLGYEFKIRKFLDSHIFGDTMLICQPVS